MNTGMLVGLALLAYFFIREYGGGQGGVNAPGGTGAPKPSPAPGPAPSPAESANPTAVALHAFQTDPYSLAQALLVVAKDGGFGVNPTLTYDQWNWFATNRVQGGALLTPPDFTSVAPRDAGGSTPAVSALTYAQNYARLWAVQNASGMSGLGGGNGLSALGNVIDLRRMPTSNWTM